MRSSCSSLWIALAASLSLTGCSEVSRTVEQATSTIDVVGEPSDATPDIQRENDILGSTTITSEDDEVMVHSDSAPLDANIPAEDNDEAIDKPEDSDANDQNVVPKPPRIKTANQGGRRSN